MAILGPGEHRSLRAGTHVLLAITETVTIAVGPSVHSMPPGDALLCTMAGDVSVTTGHVIVASVFPAQSGGNS